MQDELGIRYPVHAFCKFEGEECAYAEFGADRMWTPLAGLMEGVDVDW